MEKVIVLRVKSNSYEIEFPNIGKFKAIESLKQVLSQGMYSGLMNTSTISAFEALDMIDMESYLSVLAPKLIEDLKCKSFNELGFEDYLELKKVYKETQNLNKKQIKGLEEITGTLNKNTDKSIRSTEQTLTSVFRGATGGLGGAVTSGLGLLGVGGVATMVAGYVVSSAKAYQEGLRDYSVKAQIPISVAQAMAPSYRDKNLGMSGTEFLGKTATFDSMITRYLSDREHKGLAGVQISRGFSDQQLGQLLSIQRYSDRSSLGTIADLETYVKRTDRDSKLKLPELLETYLKISTEILNRTGRVDAMGVQQSITSVGKSYNVSGLQLDKTMTGLTQLSTLSSNPVLLSLQQQAYRKLYPEGDAWDMYKRLKNPAENADLMEAVRKQVTGFGGGGMYTKFGMASLGVDPFTVDRLMEKGISVEKRGEQTDSSKEEAASKYYEDAKNYVGSMQKVETLFKLKFLKPDKTDIIILEILIKEINVMSPFICSEIKEIYYIVSIYRF